MPTKTEKPVETILATSTLTDELREFRAKTRHVWSLKQLADRLGISRNYLTKLLRRRNPWPVSKPVAHRFYDLRANTNIAITKRRRTKRVLVFAPFPLPNTIYLHVRPRACRGHNRPTVMVANQLYCGTTKKQRATCKKLWRRKERSSEQRKAVRKSDRKFKSFERSSK